MTYTELVAAVCSYLQNYETDFVANIPLFIAQAEQRIYNSVQFPTLRKTTTLATVLGDKFLDTPSDFLAPYSISVADVSGAYTYLLNKDVNFIRQAYPDPTSTGLPKYYAIFGPQAASITELRFILGPTPDAVYTAELQYFYYPTSMSVSNPNTWLGDNFSSVLLYGTLVEAYTYLKGETDLLQVYDTKYKEALALAKRLGDGMQRQDAYRSGQFRQAVT
jgi:hypothetical protein